VLTISPVQASVQVTSTGYVIPQVWSKIGAKVPGRLAEVLIQEGDEVKAGMVIARLSDDDQKSAVAAARTRVLMARARTETARANLAEITRQVERTRSLVAGKAVPRAQLEDLEMRALALTEMVRVAKAETVAAEAEESTLRVGLKDREITSPIGGTVISKPAAVGETISPEIPIAEIADFNSIVVETDVPESRLHLVKPGTPCEIVLDAYPTRRFRGVTSEIGKRINRAKATVVAKVKFKDTMEGILPEMSARVSFLTEEMDEQALKEKPKKVVAAAAITERNGQKVLFVVEDGKLQARKTTVGAVIGSNVELLDDISPGTRVVRNPSSDLYDGQRVKEQEN
jgi:RND family efflux transporter MFP subunit